MRENCINLHFKREITIRLKTIYSKKKKFNVNL